MRVLFVNPPAFNELTTVVGKEITENSSFQPPLGLLYIASYLRKNSDHEVRVIDSQVDRLSYSQLEAEICQWKPDMVGLTAMTFTMVDVMLTAQLVKNVDPEIVVCLGGPHVDLYPEETIRLKAVDFAIMKGGEEPFSLLVGELSGKRHFDRVPGLVYRENGHEVHINPRTSPGPSLEDLPFPDRTMVPYQKYYSIMTANRPVGTMITAKGCPYLCVFCSERGARPFWRSGASVAEEVEQCKKIGIQEMFFVDDTFYVKKKESVAIAQALIDRHVGMPWGARARVNNLDREMLKKFKESGCRRLHIGVEAGSDKVLKTLKKAITVEQARQAFRLCREVGIDTMAYFIVGSPGETLEDVNATLALACELEPTMAQFSRMTPMPGTDLYEMGLRSGILPRDYWREFAQDPLGSAGKGFRPMVWTENFTEEELFALADHHTRGFYFRPKYIMRSVMQIRSFHSVVSKAKAARDLFKGTSPSKTKLQKLI
jgi:radical SAM superfamily enzyme YgiQ (UPF0313 family)